MRRNTLCHLLFAILAVGCSSSSTAGQSPAQPDGGDAQTDMPDSAVDGSSQQDGPTLPDTGLSDGEAGSVVPDAPVAPDAGTCEPAYGTFGVGNWPAACWRPYADSSPFNQPIPANPKLHPNSTAIVEYLNTRFGGGPRPLQAIDTVLAPQADYYHPVYYSQPDDPLFTFHCFEPWGTCAIEGMQVRIPDAARQAGGTDAHLTVVDQSTGWEWNLWEVKEKPAGGGTLQTGWGGRTRIDGDGLGGMATAAGFGNLAGIIRAQELESGEIRHALFMVVGCTSKDWVWPANQAALPCVDQGLPDENAVPDGARFQLDISDAEIDALAVPSWKKAILRAMARYGMYVGDTNGLAYWQLEAESGQTYTSFGMPDPLVQYAIAQGLPLLGGSQYQFPLADGVDWSRLRVIDPCVAQGTCP